MKRCGLILLLLSGYVMVCHLQSDQLVRQLHLVDLQKSWNDAQQYCRDEYIDLAIVNSSALIQEAQKRAGSTEAWIGLSKSDWKWSQTGPVQSSWFNFWSLGQPGTGECVITSKLGSWSTKPCSATYYFVCYDAVTNKYILVQNFKTWSNAQSYCRQRYTDLSTINDWSDNNQIAFILPTTVHAWIGLYRNYWTWSNSSTASNLPWGLRQPNNSVNCATIVGSTGSFNSHNCDDQRPFLCSTDVKPSASRSVKVQLRAGSADLNDPTVQESILQQVREKLVEQGIREEVNLRWKTQPDGKIFHREEETAGYCEKEDCGSV
ncbi:putative C-type lectin domain family 20 member A isoform X1 [Oreochromis niloticus]|uniref:putative C-type lectin domain family 20 member A isoform X1 n=2 Tax=Oreochromis niloticus TaxID=8128 RepID=UPI000393DB9F|nr:putative C-type lectin domain family 20 member A isoform X1 [Oreochromis niloticus]